MRERVPGALAGERVDRVVSTLWGLPRREAAALVAAGGVRLAGRPVSSRALRVAEGDVLEVEAVETGAALPSPAPEVAVPVVFADDDVVVVDKPAGLVVHPGAGRTTGTLVQGLLARYPELAGVGDPARPGVVHRLDAGTSGLLVVARTADAYTSLVAQLAARTVERTYLCLVWGRVVADEGLVDAPLGRSGRRPTRRAVARDGRPARTRYRVMRRHDDPDVTLLECRLETGRTHQIRVHLAAIGHPVVDDPDYGGGRRPLGAGRPFLHAHRLGFDQPRTGARMTFSSPLPADLGGVLATAGITPP